MVNGISPQRALTTAFRATVALLLLVASLATTATTAGAQTAPQADISLGVGASNYRNSNDVRLRMGVSNAGPDDARFRMTVTIPEGMDVWGDTIRSLGAADRGCNDPGNGEDLVCEVLIVLSAGDSVLTHMGIDPTPASGPQATFPITGVTVTIETLDGVVDPNPCNNTRFAEGWYQSGDLTVWTQDCDGDGFLEILNPGDTRIRQDQYDAVAADPADDNPCVPAVYADQAAFDAAVALNPSISVTNCSGDNTNTLTITGPPEGTNIPSGNPTVTGTTDPGSTVTITGPNNTTCTTTADQNGNYTCQITGLPNGGPHTLTVESIDPNGNQATTSTTINVGEKDSDGDGVPDDEEDEAPGGDGNGDGVPDRLQSTVVTKRNPATGATSTFVVSGDCLVVDAFDIVQESELSSQDAVFNYPVGLIDFVLDCGQAGDSVEVTVFYDDDYDTSSWLFRKFDDRQRSYRDISSIATFGDATVGGTTVTTVTYSLTDGGANDVDGLANGTIVDPAGPATSTLGGPPAALAFTGPSAAEKLTLAGLLLVGAGVGLRRASRSRTLTA